jgi:hypothetical protein
MTGATLSQLERNAILVVGLCPFIDCRDAFDHIFRRHPFHSVAVIRHDDAKEYSAKEAPQSLSDGVCFNLSLRLGY